MRVRVIKPFTAYWNYSVTHFNVDAEADGDLARHLADNAPEGAVEVVEADPEPVAPGPGAAGDDSDDGPGSDGDGAAGGEPPVDGTIDDLMAWVDGSPERAAQALEAEQAKDKPRSTVVKRLTALADTEE